MRSSLRQAANRVYRKHKLNKWWHRAVRAMGMLVVFCTTYALILPAITMVQEPACGKEAHEHTQACYEQRPVKVFSCGLEEAAKVVHSHDLLCFEEQGRLICQLAVCEEHIHDDTCVSETDVLICGKEETPEHVHSDSCMTQSVLICGLQEREGHTHGDSCDVTMAAQVDAAAAVHIHGETCYEIREIPCEIPESDGHVHGDECGSTEQILICTESTEPAQNDTQVFSEGFCTIPETPAHTHEDACYEVQATECTQEQTQGHAHTETCYEKQLICGKDEVRLHSHAGQCYDAAGILLCQQPQVLEHIHSPECLVELEELQDVLICELEEHIHVEACYPEEEEPDWNYEYICGFGVHSHGDACYDETGGLICTIPEHAHELACIVDGLDLTADVETEEQWMSSFSDVAATGYWPADVLAVAQTQLDYSESTKNVILTEAGLLKGYTRYGAWYGQPYDDWNVFFAAFCLHYAGVDVFSPVPDHDQWIQTMAEEERYLPADQYIPRPGDLVFMDWDQELSESDEAVPVDVDCVGILAELVPASEEEPAMMKILAGDIEDQVCCLSLEKGDPALIGYGLVPEAEAGIFSCGMTNHSHSWICMDDSGELRCDLEEHTHNPECTVRTLTYDDGAMHVAVTLDNFAGCPEDLSVRVVPITRETESNEFSAMVTAVGKTMVESAYYVNDAIFYRVELLSEGAVYEVPERVQTDVLITMTQPAFTPEAIAASAGLRTFSLLEEEAPAEAVTEEPEFTEETVLFTSTMRMMTLDAPAAEPGGEASGPMEETEEIPESSYQAIELSPEDPAEDQISFHSVNAVTFGVALTNVTSTTGYWERVTSASQLTSGDKYLIVSAEGNYALNNTGGGTRVYIDAIKGNTNYYTITTSSGAPIDMPAAYWTFFGSGNSFAVTNPYTASYDYYIDLTSYVIRTENYSRKADSLTMTLLPGEGSWTFWDNNYYLVNNNSNTFQRSYNTAAYTRSMLIFKQVSVSLDIPDDVVSTPGTGSGTETPSAPSYPDYLPESDGLQGEIDYVTTEGNTLKVQYYSDPATSQLESHFSLKTHGTVAAQAENNGMVHSDKSVIYGGDDYGAFGTYDPNTFGVTLSALGQEFATGDKETIHIPVDVMLVLDISGSMNMHKVPNSSDLRSEAMVKAVNTTIREIMDRNPNNRVGAVLFSSGTGNLLELGRYTQRNDQYLVMRDDSWESDDGNTLSGKFIYPNSTLYKDGQLYSTNVYPYQMDGTYTQAGIALGAQKLMEVPDITCDVTAFEGTPNETTIKVRRQPVIILLSDGEPTHCNSNYKDVLNGPHYGDGQAGQAGANYKGVHGYYTILSANYYKKMVGIHYHQPAQFYSVGMGINAEGADPADEADDAYYKRAVLDPTSARVNAANTQSKAANNAENASKQLYKLLNNSYNGTTINVTVESQSYMPPWMGEVHRAVPVIQNPYAGDYSYANGAYFGNYNAETLAKTFGDILDLTEAISEYGFILRSRTALKMEDPVGEGMEVKGAPVLRYGGNNYTATAVTTSEDGKTTSYTYDYFYESNDGSGFTADLSKVVVKVETDNNGLQTVYMDVPDYILPAYSPYMKGVDENAVPVFYYEALPIRLIYQVGLTAAGEQELADIYSYGGEAVFYTNRYENDTIANASLLPTADNPYYMKNASPDGNHENCHHIDKSSNVTGTVGSSFECHHALVDHVENGTTNKVPEVTQKLGNNGKIMARGDRKVIDIPIEKIWHEGFNPAEMEPVVVELYSVTDKSATLVQTLEVSAATQWKGKFQRLPILPEGSFYAIREIVPEGCAVIYEGEVISITLAGKPVRAVKVQAQNPVETDPVRINNSGEYVLPETGGMGTGMYTFSGMLLLAAACVYYIIYFGRKRQKGGAA